MVQKWEIRGDRLFAEVELTVRGVPGDSFLLLRAPAVLTDFKGDGLRVGKVDREGRSAYYIAPEREGTLTARVRFEMPVPDRAQALTLPTGPAAAQRVTLESAGATGSGPGIRQITAPINPQDTATLKVDVKPGSYSVHVGGDAIRAARLKVGPERESAQNDLLQP